MRKPAASKKAVAQEPAATPEDTFDTDFKNWLADGECFVIQVRDHPQGMRPGQLLGHIALSLRRATARYARHLRDERLDGIEAREDSVKSWLVTNGWELSHRVASDLPLVLDLARRQQRERGSELVVVPALERASTRPPIEAEEKRKAFRDRFYRTQVMFGLNSLLQHRLTEAIPSAPRLKTVDAPAELNVFGYLGIAMDTGDGAAFDAVMRWLKGQMKSGRKSEDWQTILYEVSAARKELDPIFRRFAAARNKRLVWNAAAKEPIGRRICDNDLVDELIRARGRTSVAIALVSKERKIGRANLTEMWRRKKKLFPAVDFSA